MTKNKIKIWIKKYSWTFLAISFLLLRWLGGFFPDVVEKLYAQGLFLGIRAVFDYTAGLIPVPMFYVFFIALLFSLGKNLKAFFLVQRPLRERVQRLGNHLLKSISILIVWFLGIWGFNYARIPIEEKLELTIKPLPIQTIKAETQWVTRKTLEFRKLVVGEDTAALTDALLPQDLEAEMRKNLKSVLEELGYVAFGNVRARELYPGLLLRWKTAGVYWFFVGEGNIDGGLHPLQKPFTMAHEMAHGYGFGDEGTCNFLAYLACLRSSRACIKYAGMLSYWRYMAGEYRYRLPNEFETFKNEYLSAGMANDLQAIYDNQKKYPSWMDGIRDAAYDTYLKSQGISDGLENYSRVVLLVTAWKMK